MYKPGSGDYPKSNSTEISIEGKIAVGEKIKLKSYIAPKNVFKLSIKVFETNKRFIWGDAMGKRAYKLTTISNGNTNFSRTQKIGGLLFPLFAKRSPSFDDFFEKLAN